MVRLVAHASSTGTLGGCSHVERVPAGLFPALRVVMATSGANYAHMLSGEPKHSRQTVRVSVQLPRSADLRIN